jgi:hypothetical protein
MASKRPPLSFSELDARGRRAILRTPDEVKAEEELLKKQDPDASLSQPTSKPARQHDSIPVQQHDSSPASQLVKATFYLSPDHVMRLEQVRLARLQKGEKVDKSTLVREAIDLLASEVDGQ